MVLLVVVCIGFIQSAVFYRNSPKQIERERRMREDFARRFNEPLDDYDDDYYY